MEKIVLIKAPNQNFNVSLENADVDITLKTSLGGAMYIDFVKGDQKQYGILCTPNQLLFTPMFSGRFVFICQDNDYPDYRRFGSLHNLYYIPKEELNG